MMPQLLRQQRERLLRIRLHRPRVQVLLATLVLPLVLVLQTACGIRAEAAQPLHVGLVTSLSGLGDAGLNDLTYAGLQRAEQSLGISGNVSQPKRSSDIAPDMIRDIRAGDTVIIGVGYQMERPAGQVAQQYPHVTFVLVDALPRASSALDSTLQLPNVASIYFNDQQAGALAGGFAALLLRQQSASANFGANPIDVFASASTPPTRHFSTGFQWGVHYMQTHEGTAQPSPVEMTYTGAATSPQSSSTCTPYVEQAAQSGAALLVGLSASCQRAVIREADALNLPCVGVYANQNARGTCVAGSVVERADLATYSMLAAIRHSAFTSGLHAYDLASGDISLLPGSAHLSTASQARLHTFEQQLTTLQLVPTQYPHN